MSKRFCKRFNEARTFGEWVARLKQFDYALIRDNGLQAWTIEDYKTLWNKHKNPKEATLCKQS